MHTVIRKTVYKFITLCVYCDFFVVHQTKTCTLCFSERAFLFTICVCLLCVLYDEFCLAKCQNPVNEPSERQSRQMESILRWAVRSAIQTHVSVNFEMRNTGKCSI